MKLLEDPECGRGMPPGFVPYAHLHGNLLQVTIWGECGRGMGDVGVLSV